MTRSPRRFVLPLALAVILAAPGCGASDGNGPAGEGAAPESASQEPAPAAKGTADPTTPSAPATAPAEEGVPPIPADAEVRTTPSGLRYSVLEDGTGTVRPKTGERVRVHYTGWTTDGRVFDSSREGGEPAEFVVGQVIEGWNEALAMMREGDRWKLTIPPDLGYGDRGAGARIPPGATLIFDVELLDVFHRPEFVKPDPGAQRTTASGLKYQVIEPGEGEPPAETDFFDLEFAIWNDSGEFLDATAWSGQRIQGRKGDLRLPFLEEAPFLMRAGATFLFEVPGSLGFGDRSPSPLVPVGATTIWRLTLRAAAAPLPVPEFRAPDPSTVRRTESGLGIATLAEGSGPSPGMGQEVTVHYAGWLEDGTLFDASYPRAFPATFRLGRVIQGWNEGLQRMKPGGEAILVVPPGLGYGARGAGDKIPPGATLIFRVKLLEVGE